MSERRTALTQRDTLSELRESLLRRGFLGTTVEGLADSIGRPPETVARLGPSPEAVHREAVRSYFLSSARRVASTLSETDDPHQRVFTYLTAIADELSRASDTFLADVLEYEPTRTLYQDSTRRAAATLTRLIADAQEVSSPGQSVTYRFVSAMAGQMMETIQSGALEAQTSLSDSAAYFELAHVVLSSLDTSRGSRGQD